MWLFDYSLDAKNNSKAYIPEVKKMTISKFVFKIPNMPINQCRLNSDICLCLPLLVP